MSTERRIHVASIPAVDVTVVLDQAASRHLAVLRLGVGDEVTLFDGKGARAIAVVDSVDRTDDRFTVRVTRRIGDAATRAPTVLVQCMPKGTKIDDIVRAATELGVDAIRIATSERSISKPGERWDTRRERLERIAREAARQAERDDVPALHAPRPVLEHAAEAEENAVRWSLCGRTGALPGAVAGDRPIWLVVGPEGGLSERELTALDALGYTRTKVAPTVLRVETAAIAALAVSRLVRGGR